MTDFAIVLQLYTITHSALAVGAAGLFKGVPSMLFVLLGGSLGDAVDRRKLVLLATTGQALVSTTLAVQAAAGLRSVAVLYTLLVVQSLLGAINAPARRTFLPRLLPAELVRSGAALNTLFTRAAEVTGPALAGWVVALAGITACYAADAVSFGAALLGVSSLPPMPPEGGAGAGPSAQSALAGLRYVVSQPMLGGAFLVDLSVTVCGVSTALFPALNAAYFGGQPITLGWLMGASGVGGLIVLFVSGWLSRIRREGMALILAGLAWGGCMTCVGLSRSLGLTVVLLATCGALDSILVVIRSALVQIHTPDALRGRVSALDYLVGAGGPQLGNVRAGLLGSLLPAGSAMAISGLCTIAALCVTALALPAFRRHTAQASE